MLRVARSTMFTNRCSAQQTAVELPAAERTTRILQPSELMLRMCEIAIHGVCIPNHMQETEILGATTGWLQRYKLIDGEGLHIKRYKGLFRRRVSSDQHLYEQILVILCRGCLLVKLF